MPGVQQKSVAVVADVAGSLHGLLRHDRSEATHFADVRFSVTAWERHTHNPPIGEITDEDMEAFRASAIKAGGSPSTINICRSVLRAILRRVGPRETRNPAAEDCSPKSLT